MDKNCFQLGKKIVFWEVEKGIALQHFKGIDILWKQSFLVLIVKLNTRMDFPMESPFHSPKYSWTVWGSFGIQERLRKVLPNYQGVLQGMNLLDGYFSPSKRL